jgi:hypothetical protein
MADFAAQHKAFIFAGLDKKYANNPEAYQDTRALRTAAGKKNDVDVWRNKEAIPRGGQEVTNNVGTPTRPYMNNRPIYLLAAALKDGNHPDSKDKAKLSPEGKWLYNTCAYIATLLEKEQEACWARQEERMKVFRTLDAAGKAAAFSARVDELAAAKIGAPLQKNNFKLEEMRTDPLTYKPRKLSRAKTFWKNKFKF